METNAALTEAGTAGNANDFRAELRRIRTRAATDRRRAVRTRADHSLAHTEDMLVRMEQARCAVSVLRELMGTTLSVLPAAELSTGYFDGQERLSLRHVHEALDDELRLLRDFSEMTFQVTIDAGGMRVVCRETLRNRDAEPELWALPASEDGRARLAQLARDRLAQFAQGCLAPSLAA